MNHTSTVRGSARRSGRASLAVLGALLMSTALAAPALADGPGVGTPTVVSVGDSYISGEAGRWAGNTNGSSNNTDAGGSGAYNDAGTTEAIARCHRSTAAEIHIGGGIASKNLACSGAKVGTVAGQRLQARPRLLQRLRRPGSGARAAVLRRDAQREDDQPLDRRQRLQLRLHRPDVRQRLAAVPVVVEGLLQRRLVGEGELHRRERHREDDAHQERHPEHQHRDGERRATPPRSTRSSCRTTRRRSPAAPGFRYSESGYTRQNTGGCGFWNNDANWANNTALPTINNAVKNGAAQTGLPNVKIMELQATMNGRRLCENTVGLLEEKGLATWQSAGAVDKSEWIEQIRTVSTVFGPYFVQESLHPNWWGQKAMRNCVRQAYNGGTPRGGTCTRTANGLNANGEPNMTLQ